VSTQEGKAAKRGRPHLGPPLSGTMSEVVYPPGCVTPFTLSVYGAYCATSSVRSW
jgi:hypothetical protein